MTCRDLMTKNPAFCVLDDTVTQAIQTMAENNTGVLPIVLDSGDRRLIGIVTDRDLMIRVDAAGREPSETAIAEVMTANPVSCQAAASYSAILGLMTDHSLRRLPVVDSEDRLIGIVTLDDVLPYVGGYETRQAPEGKGVFAAGAGLCLAAGVGAGLMYLFDPSRGKARRTVLRDKALSACDKGKHIFEQGAADLRNRAEGVTAELRKAVRPEEPVSDEKLIARVRTHLGRVLTHPHSIRVSVKDGSVVLAGNVRPYVMKSIAASVKTVTGVKAVENQLTVQEAAKDTPPVAGWRHAAGSEARVSSAITGLISDVLPSLGSHGR